MKRRRKSENETIVFMQSLKNRSWKKGSFLKTILLEKIPSLTSLNDNPSLTTFLREKIYFWSENFQVISLHKKKKHLRIVRTQNKKLTLPEGLKLFLPILCQLVANKKYVFRTTSRQWDGEGGC